MSNDLSLAQHTGLAFLLSQHTSEQSAHDATKSEVVIIRNAVKAERGTKSAKAQSNGEQAAPIHDKPAVFGVVMPERNTLDAKSFIAAVKAAGRRQNDQGKFFTDTREVRNDLIKAIHAYVGYDQSLSFGAQDTAARAKASRELSGKTIVVGPSREELKAASRSAAGFVAGLPDHKARRLQDLVGRETAAVDAMLAHERDANDKARSTADRLLSQGLADVERERLASIRADIAAFG